MKSTGGGDGPEAVTAALKEACDGLEWRDSAAKMAILIAVGLVMLCSGELYTDSI